MTLDDFRASRHFCPDMRLAVGDLSDPYFDEDEPCPAYIYEGQLVIDVDPYGGLPSVTIGNDSHSGELAELEKELFEYGVREGIFSLASGS